MKRDGVSDNLGQKIDKLILMSIVDTDFNIYDVYEILIHFPDIQSY